MEPGNALMRIQEQEAGRDDAVVPAKLIYINELTKQPMPNRPSSRQAVAAGALKALPNQGFLPRGFRERTY
jgi:hypothetical protein